ITGRRPSLPPCSTPLAWAESPRHAGASIDAPRLGASQPVLGTLPADAQAFRDQADGFPGLIREEGSFQTSPLGGRHSHERQVEMGKITGAPPGRARPLA